MPDNTQDNTSSKMIDKFASGLFDQIRHQGVSFALLALIAWYFQGQTVEMKKEIKLCNDALFEMYRSDRARMIEVINNNTQALLHQSKDGRR